MANRQLVESVSTVSRIKGNRWKVVLAAPGKGMSANYTAEKLREYGPIAVPDGTKGYITHKLPQDRSPLEQFARYEKVRYEEDLNIEKYPEGALVGEMVVKQAYIDMIEDLGEDAEFSMFILDGDTDENGNMTRMGAHRANSVDLVAYGGLEGTGLVERLTESYSLPGQASDRTSAQGKNESKVKMDQETKDAIAAAVAAAIAPLKTTIDTLATGASAEAVAKAKADAEAAAEAEVGTKVDEALSEYEANLKLVDDAAKELTPAQVESLKVEARKGTDVKPLIESYKAVVADVRKTLTESFEATGGFVARVNEDGSLKSEDFSIPGWGA